MTGGAPHAVAVGVDVGGTKVLGVAITPLGTVLAERKVATPRAAPGVGAGDRAGAPGFLAGALADTVAGVVRELWHGVASGTAGPSPAWPAPVGMGIAGLVDRSGVLRFSPHLEEVVGSDLVGLVSARLDGAAVRARNDAECAAVAEHALGAARGARDVLLVTLGTGIGGALIADGEVRIGAHGYAGEIGHMVVDPNGPSCACGGRGCWERYASGGGLERLAREAALAGALGDVVRRSGGDPEAVRGEDVTSAAADGDPDALAVVEQLGFWLGLGLANLVAVADPERVVVGGGLARVGEMILGPARRALEALVQAPAARGTVAVVPALLGERAGAIGAALVGRGGGP